MSKSEGSSNEQEASAESEPGRDQATAKNGWISFVETVAKSKHIPPVTHKEKKEERGATKSPKDEEAANSSDDGQLDSGGQRSSSGARTGQKRSSSDVSDHEISPGANGGGKEDIRRARAERKRCREKQRRNNVNRGYDELTELIMKIDAADAKSDGSEENGDGSTGAPANRVDLIARSVQVMSRLFEENTALKKKLAGASATGDPNGERANSAPTERGENVGQMLVPVMVPWDGGASRGHQMQDPVTAGLQHASAIYAASGEKGGERMMPVGAALSAQHQHHLAALRNRHAQSHAASFLSSLPPGATIGRAMNPYMLQFPFADYARSSSSDADSRPVDQRMAELEALAGVQRIQGHESGPSSVRGRPTGPKAVARGQKDQKR